MKKISFFALALAAGLMMGCSDEVGNDVNPGGTGSATVGEGFMSVAINLPTTTGGSRASVDGFDDGLDTEWAVKNGKLIIFGGNSEATATYQATYDLANISTAFQTNGTITDQITSTAVVAVSTKTMQGPNFYPVVILNTNSQDLTLTSSSKISDLATKILAPASGDESALRADGFLMANAPLAQVPGGTSATAPTTPNIMICPSFTEDAIKSTAADAMDAPAASIYVERVHAKVTLTAADNLNAPNVTDLGTMSIVGWTLDNTNKTSYLIRNVACGTTDIPSWWAYKSTKAGTPSPEYRFIEDAPVATNLYRTYWGIDPNYRTYDASAFNRATSNESVTYSTEFGTRKPLYCLENTFNTENMKDESTTAVIVKAQFNGGKDFYTANGIKNVIYQKTDVINKAATLCTNYLETIKGNYFKGTISGTDLDITLSETEGKVTIESITLNDPADADFEWANDQAKTEVQELITAQLDDFNADETFKYELYKGGNAYYRLLIKHFGDEDTPWTDSDKVDDDSYPGTNAENQWLGRYGMVRNNWYDITVTGARELGSSTIPSVTGTWDDDVRNLAVTINILSWAKRTQNVEL